MPSPFDDLMSAADAAILSVFGETEGAVLVPRQHSEYKARVADPSRASLSLRGVFSAGPSMTELRGVSKHEFVGTTRLSGMSAEFWIAPADAASIPYQIAVGDLLRLPGRGGQTFSIVAIQTTDVGDVNLILSVED